MRQCYFCSQNMQEIDYKDTDLVSRFVSNQGKIIDPRHTGICASHQRKLATAVKHARHMALLPFTRK